MHRHRKLGKILPIGGHIEPHELPDVAAVREVREETGLDVELHDSDPTWSSDDVVRLVRPIAVLLEDISPGHQHIDLIYFARVRSAATLEAEYAPEELLWLTREELSSQTIPGNVRILAVQALDTLGAAEPVIGPPIRLATEPVHNGSRRGGDSV